MIKLTKEPKRLIETFFPSLSEDGKKAAHSSRTLNVWTWRARRTEVVTRAMCISSCLRPGEEKEFWDVFRGKSTLSCTILDPFCGSGTTVRTAAQIGGIGVGGDISELAVVNAMASTRLSPEELRYVCEEKVWPLVRELYTARCICGEESDKTVFFYGTEQEGEKGKKIVAPDYVGDGFFCCGEIVFAFCPQCGRRTPVSSCEQLHALGKILERDTPCPRHLLFVAGVCRRCGKFVRRATAEDVEKLVGAEKIISPQFSKLLKKPLTNRQWRRLHKEGIHTLYDLLTPRGVATLQILFDATEDLEQETRKYARLFVANSILRASSRLTKWTREGVMPLSGELVYNPTFIEISPVWERGFVSLACSLESAVVTRTLPGQCKFFVGDATRIPFPNGYFDAVITDPPYYDLIEYEHIEELASFIVPLSPRRQVPFVDMMADALRECERVVKEDGVIAFTFQYPSARGWEHLANAIRSSGLRVTAIHSAINDRVVSLARKMPRADTIIICRKVSSGEHIEENIPIGIKEAERWGAYLAAMVNWEKKSTAPQITKWTQKRLYQCHFPQY